jgi:hypothetical protein
MDTQQKLNFNHEQFEKIYQVLRAKGCPGTAGHPDYKSFLNRDRKVEQVREPQVPEALLVSKAISTSGKIQRPMFGYGD